MYVSLLSRLNAWNHAAANVHMIHWRCPKTELKTVASHAGVDVQFCLSFTDHHTIELYGARSLALIEESVVALMFRPCFLPPKKKTSITNRPHVEHGHATVQLSDMANILIGSPVAPMHRRLAIQEHTRIHWVAGELQIFQKETLHHCCA